MNKILHILVICVLLVLGCSKINHDNYKKLGMGMTYDQVVATLGNPDQCKAVLGARNCIWGDSEKQITIQFIGDKVVLFSSKGI